MVIGWLWHEKTKAPVTGFMMIRFGPAGQVNRVVITL